MTNEDISERNYLKSVQTLAQRIAQGLIERSEAELDAWDDCLEAAANSRWAFITEQAKRVLDWSKNRDAIFDMGVIEGAQCMAQLWCEAARAAMAQDLMDAVTAILNEQDRPSSTWIARNGEWA